MATPNAMAHFRKGTRYLLPPPASGWHVLLAQSPYHDRPLPEGFLFSYPAWKARREKKPGWEGSLEPETHTGLAQNGPIQGSGGRGGGGLGALACSARNQRQKNG